MDYIEKWISNLLTPSPYNPIKQETESWGEYKKHTGPATRYAKVLISIGPSSRSLEVIDRLDKDKATRLRQEECYDQIIFGVLDVMMTFLSSPINSFKLVILDAVYEEVTSVPIAFRLAAREAARKILSGQAKAGEGAKL